MGTLNSLRSGGMVETGDLKAARYSVICGNP